MPSSATRASRPSKSYQPARNSALAEYRVSPSLNGSASVAAGGGATSDTSAGAAASRSVEVRVSVWRTKFGTYMPGPPSCPGAICMYGSRSSPTIATSCVSPRAIGLSRRTMSSGCSWRYQSTSLCSGSWSSVYRTPFSSKARSAAGISTPSIDTVSVPTDESHRLRYQGRVSASARPSGWTRRLSSWISPFGMMFPSVCDGCRASESVGDLAHERVLTTDLLDGAPGLAFALVLAGEVAGVSRVLDGPQHRFPGN